MYNIAHVKATKNSNFFFFREKIVTFFLLKNTNYLLKSYIFNITDTSFKINFFFGQEVSR